MNYEEQLQQDMLSFISKYWDIKTGDEQIYGSPADIYAEIIKDDVKYWMRVDDGNCYNQLKNAVYHVYVSDIDGKIFEDRVTSKKEFKIVMKVLGFIPKKIDSIIAYLVVSESGIIYGSFTNKRKARKYIGRNNSNLRFKRIEIL